MTWFKSIIMRQKSPLLLIDSRSVGGPTERHATRQAGVRPECLHRAQFKGKPDRHSNTRNDAKPPSETTQPHRLPHLVQADRQVRSSRVREEEVQTRSGCERSSITSYHSAPLSATSQQETVNQLEQSRRRDSGGQMGEQEANQIGRQQRRRVSPPFPAVPRRATVAALGTLSACRSQLASGNLSILIQLVMITTLVGLASAAGSGQQYFEVQPEAQYLVHNGNDARLRCLIRNRQGECLWLRNGKAIGFIAKKYQFIRQPEDGDCSLMIRNVSVTQDDGQWQCQVTASDVEQDTLQSREVHLVVLVAPDRPQIKNTSQNTQRIILEENKTKFVTCEMRGGNPAPQIEWILDNRNISKEAQTSSFSSPQPGGASQRITQSKLKLSDIKRSMNGKNLTCVGVHPTMNQSTSVELDVQYLPTVSVNQREYSIVEGSPLSISCQVDSNPPPNIVNWRLVSDGASVSNGKGGSITLPTRPGPVLEFDRISRDLNQNTFECLAQNSYGISMPADVKINVMYAPLSLNTSSADAVAVGSEARLTCLFDGNPEPEIKWYYMDPLSRSPKAVELEHKSPFLDIKNATYRNEGDYYCEAQNQINGVGYGSRSSNIMLDVFGEPQFLVKSPVHAKAVQGTKSDLSVAFCSDPTPNKVFWQFGSLRIDVKLNNINNGQQSASSQQAPSGSARQNPVSARFQAHPLQPIYKRESTFSKAPSCFEAQLSLLEPELTDQRDYLLVVQNERGHQSATVRLRVSSPLSPMLMITSAFVTICGLFLMSLVVMFLVRKGRKHGPQVTGANGSQAAQAANLGPREKGAVEHLVANGNGLASAAAINGQLMQQTRGVVNGAGNGIANGASNPANGNAQVALAAAGQEDFKSGQLHLMSMASSDTSGDQKQLLFSSSDRNSSASGSTSTNQCVDFHVNSSHSTGHSSANSTPVPLNHISVEQDELQEAMSGASSTYQAAESVTRDAQLSPQQLANHLTGNGTLIYANLDYAEQQQANILAGKQAADQHHMDSLRSRNRSPPLQQFSIQHNANTGTMHQMQPVQRRRQTPMEHSPTGSSMSGQSSILQTSCTGQPSQASGQVQLDDQANSRQRSPSGIRSNVGATIAMMNSLAAASQNQTSSPISGVLNGAINQQLANSRQVRKPGPPKPPKPSIQQRSRFYQPQGQQQQHGNQNGLVMIGSPAPNSVYQAGSMATSDRDEGPSANELAVEYSRIAFPARAEL